MHTPLLPHLASSQGFRRLLGTAAGFALMLAAAPAAQAQTVYGLGTLTAAVGPFTAGQQGLVLIDAGTGVAPSISTPITGVTAGQTLVGIDFRPFNGQLYALGYNATNTTAQFYTLNPSTSVATPVAAAITLNLGTATDRIGFDFNPTVDRIRVVSTNDADFRLNPDTGVVVATDGTLAYASGTPGNPGVGSVAYTNSFAGSTATTLYDYDELNLITNPGPNGGTTNILSVQNPPNSGTLTAQQPVTFNGFQTGVVRAIDLDIYYNPDTQQNQAFLVEVNNTGASNFYSLDLNTGAATRRGNTVPTGTPFEIRDIAAAPAAAITGQLAYGVTSQGVFVSFDTGNPSIIRSAIPITGVAANQTLVGTDFRPNTGQLFGLGYDFTAAAGSASANLYTINLTTGVATQVPGSSAIPLDLGDATNSIGFDFNPTVDRIRVVSTNDRNYRLNPNNGAVAATDGNIAYAAGNPNAGTDPAVGTAAYVNSFVGSTTTFLYTLDHALGLINFQNPPNAGTQAVSRSLTGVNGAGVGGAINAQNDFDVYFDGTANVPYLVAIPNNQATSRLYRLASFSTTATTDQAATDLGLIGSGLVLRDISVPLSAASTVPTTLAALTGRLLYAVASGNLISFDSGNPGVIRTAVNITGLPADGSQVLAGSDFRPLDGQLFALGYNAATSQGQIYTLNLTTGALTAVGGLNAMTLGAASGIGFDFNPVADRIRIVGANGNNYRLNPADGVLATVNDGPTGRALSGTAYNNNDNNANTGTTQYGYDQSTNEVVVFSNPNAGTNATVGSSGISVNTANGVDFDIYSDLTNPAVPQNTAFVVAAPGTTTADVLYNVNLANGAFTSLGQIGSGSNLSGLAAFLTPGPVIAAGLTWTGAVSTDWGTAGNWSPAQVPTAADNVIIPDVTNDPVVTGTQSANAVTLTTGAVLTLADASVLNVSGNIVNNSATIAASGTNVTGRITLAGTVAQTISGTLTTFPNLTVGTAGASIAGPVSIRRGLVLNGTFNTASQTLTLLSDATGTAYVVNNGSAAVSGSATVQRYITPNLNAGAGYRHYSSPVSGNTVADFATAGYSPSVNPAYNGSATPPLVTPFPNIYSYDQSRLGLANSSPEFDKGFQSPAATSDAIETGRGYTVNINASALVDFTGTLNTGLVSQGSLARGAQATAGWQLLGNPYPGAINYDVVRTNSTGMESALYVFKSTGQYTGTYTSYVNGASTNTGTNVLPVAQGFFVRTAEGQTGAVNFTNAARLNAPDNTPFQRTVGTRPELTLTLRSATAANQAVMYFEQGATAGFDASFDAHYLPSTNGLLLATEAGAETLAINGQADLTGADVVVPLHVAATTAGTYSLAVDNLVNLPATYHAYLRDNLTGTYTPLTPTTSLPLSLAANAPAGGRYAVVFSTQSRVLATASAALTRLATVYPNPATSSATLLLPTALRGTQATAVSVLDNLGRTVLTRTLPAGAAETLELPLAGLAPGVYSVVARTAAGIVAKRLVVQ